MCAAGICLDESPPLAATGSRAAELVAWFWRLIADDASRAGIPEVVYSRRLEFRTVPTMLRLLPVIKTGPRHRRWREYLRILDEFRDAVLCSRDREEWEELTDDLSPQPLPIIQPPAGATIYVTRPHSVELHTAFDPLPKDCSSWCWEHGETWYMPVQWKWGIDSVIRKKKRKRKQS